MEIHTGTRNKDHAWGSLVPLLLQQVSAGVCSVLRAAETADIPVGVKGNELDKEEA